MKIAAIVLAAGLSSRFEGGKKLVTAYNGKPLIRHMLDALAGSHVSEILVVTGHDQQAVERVCADMGVLFCHNANYKKGLSSSIKVGVGAAGDSYDGVLMCHGDMPKITSEHIDAICNAFKSAPEKVVAPTFNGKQGNPVLWPKRYFPQLMTLDGDKGAKIILQAEETSTVEIAFDDDAIKFDVDRA